MLVTLLGMATEESDLQEEKAILPILITPLGIMTEVTYYLQSIIVSFLIKRPSISLSTISAPQ